MWRFNGTNWTSFPSASDGIGNVKDILVSSNRIVIGGTKNFGPGIRISTNNGLSWITEYPSCSSSCNGLIDMDVDNNNVWVGTRGYGGSRGTYVFDGVSWSEISIISDLDCISVVNSNSAFATCNTGFVHQLESII